tara:strand:- start:242 stop:1000 length:759 start_codon:yes stop_codon:yes gene_type:complete
MINLITSFFIPTQVERQNELLKCLKNNINSKYIKKIYLCIEKQEDIAFLKEKINPKNKIQLILLKKQPTYADYLKIANQLQGEICMISNADIWLRNCDEQLINILKENPNICYSLTRHEYDMSSYLIKRGELGGKYLQSYDSFIFQSPINIDYKLIDHVQNRLGAENIFKIELEKVGRLFINPCKVIIIVHEHKSDIRTYSTDDDMLRTKNYYRLLKYTPILNKNEILNVFKKEHKNHRKKKFSTVSFLFSR